MDELPDDIRVQVESMLLDKTVSYKEIAGLGDGQRLPHQQKRHRRYAQRTGRQRCGCNTARENANAIITAMQEHRGLELSDAANALVMDNLIQVLSDASAEDLWGNPPAQADRAGAQEPAPTPSIKSAWCVPTRRTWKPCVVALMAELTEQVRHNPELLGQLEKASLTAAEKVVEASET